MRPELVDPSPPKGQRQEFRAFRRMDLDSLVEEVWEVKRPIHRALRAEWAERLEAWAD